VAHIQRNNDFCVFRSGRNSSWSRLCRHPVVSTRKPPSCSERPAVFKVPGGHRRWPRGGGPLGACNISCSCHAAGLTAHLRAQLPLGDVRSARRIGGVTRGPAGRPLRRAADPRVGNRARRSGDHPRRWDSTARMPGTAGATGESWEGIWESSLRRGGPGDIDGATGGAALQPKGSTNWGRSGAQFRHDASSAGTPHPALSTP
jgi:hypothetical protein